MSDAGPATKQVVAILLMVVTVVGGVFGVIAARAADEQVDANRNVENSAVRMLDERSRAAGRISAEQQAENTAAEQRANARALRRYSSASLDLQVERRSALEAAAAATAASELGPGHSVLRESTAVAERFKERQRRGYATASEYANAYDQQSRQLGNKVDSLLAVIAALGIGVFLVGLTLAVSHRAARRVLAGTGAAIAAVVTVWGITVATQAIQPPSRTAITAFVHGLETRRAAFAELNNPATGDAEARRLMVRSIDDFDAAIRARHDYAAAYFGRALALDVLAFTDPAGAHGSTQARDDYRRAAQLGYERHTVLNNLALTELRLGDIDKGIAVARKSVALRPNVANSNETLASLLRYASAKPTEEYRVQLELLKRAWAKTEASRRQGDLKRALDGTDDVAEQFPRLAARARAYRADLQRIVRELDRG
jgi:tetratricopeptide (TPR) repeat protein